MLVNVGLRRRVRTGATGPGASVSNLMQGGGTFNILMGDGTSVFLLV